MKKVGDRVGRRSTRGFTKALTFGALCVSASVFPYTRAQALDNNALPGGGTVTNGNASFDYTTPNELHIQQNSDRVVIDWNSFNIGVNALTEFHQNSSSSVAVNRVTSAGTDPTQILGTLKANGIVMVLDRNGVLFGANSVVDVGGIVASTGNIDDAAFMSGAQILSLSDISTSGKIINNGNISVADAGLAAFVSPTVINNGIIKAKMGRVALASGTAATVDLYGDGLVELAANQPLQQAMINNAGTISAQGGTVLMTATAAKDLVNTVINTSGIVDVSSVTEKGGKIILEGGNTEVSGTLDASGKTGGGTILVGGDYQGGGTIRHADKTTITNTAILKANATGAVGDGGKVVVWSDDSTRFDGTIQARGGSLSGKGGAIETSGKINLGVSGVVDAFGMDSAGEWLLDPSDVVIMGTGGTNISTSGGTVNPSTDSYQISDSSIEAALNLGNSVTITTTNTGGTQAGSITTNGTVSISKTSGASATLTLKAAKDIALSSTTISSSGSGNALNVVLNADSDGNQDGAISLTNTAITTNGGYAVLGGGSGLLFGADGLYGTADDAASTGADNVAAWGNGTYVSGITLNNGDISTGAGAIIMNGHGQNDSLTGSQNGLYIYGGSLLQSTTGKILLTGTGGDGTTSNIGVLLSGSGTGLTSSTGIISIKGTAGNGTGNANDGVDIASAAYISSTGTGATASSITVDGTGRGNSAGSNSGVSIGGSSAYVTSIDGDILITGTFSGSGVSSNRRGITLGADGYITSTGITSDAATITLIGTAGTGSTNNNGILIDGNNANNTYITSVIGDINLTGTALTAGQSGIAMLRNAKILSTGSANINLTGVSLSGADDITSLLSTAYLGGSSMTGKLTLNADSLNLSFLNLSTSSTGAIALKPRTASTSIGLGGGSGTLNLTDAELTNIGTTGTLVIGDSAAGTGDITIDSWDLSGKTFATELYGNDINFKDTDATAGVDYAVKLGTGDFTAYAKDNGADYGTVSVNGTAGSFVKSIAGTSNLILRADKDVLFYANTGISTTTGLLNVVLNADRNADHDGGIGIYSTLSYTTNGGYMVLGGGSGILGGVDGILGNGDGTGADDMAAWGNSSTNKIGVHTDAGSSINTGSGSLYISGAGLLDNTCSNNCFGAEILSDLTATGSGSINIHGYGGGAASTAYTHGAILGSQSVTTVDGDINIIGEVVSNAATAAGVALNSPNLTTTGNGSINFTVKSGGMDAYGTSPTVTSHNNITLVADKLFSSFKSTLNAANILTLKPYTTSTSIGLGGGSGTLAFTDAQLARFSAGSKLIIGDSAAGTGDITIDSWDLSGKTFATELYGNDINFNDTDATTGVDYAVKLGTGDFTAYAKDNGADYGTITVTGAAGAFSKALAGTSDLTLRADKDIVFNANSSISTTTGLLNLVLNSDRNANSDGAISITSSTFTTNGGYALLGGGSGTLWGTDGIKDTADDATSTGADNAAAWGNANYLYGVGLTSATFDLAGGDLYVSGHGGSQANQSAIYMDTSTVTTTTGKQNYKATGGTGASGEGGIRILNSTLTAASGTINITSLAAGQGDGTGPDYERAVHITNSTIQTTSTIDGQGNITISGSAIGSTGLNARGIDMDTTTNIYTNAGDISLTGKSANSGVGVTTYKNVNVLSSGTGDVAIDTSGSSNANKFEAYGIAGSVINFGSTGTGTLTINTDGFSVGTIFSATTSGFKGSTVSITPATASTSIGLGGGAGTLSLDDTELALLKPTSKLVIGLTNGTGDIVVDSWDLSGKTYATELYGNDIAFNDTDATVGVDYAMNLGSGDFTAYAKDNGGDVADLAINAAIKKVIAGTSVLTLRSDNNISSGALGDIVTTTGLLNVILDADYNNNSTGAITSAATSFVTNGGNLTFNDAVTTSTNQTWNAGAGTIKTTAAVSTGSKDLTFITDGIDIGGTISGSGTLTIRPYTSSATIGLGGGTGTLNLTDTELGYLAPSTLVIGDSVNGTGDIDIDSWDFSGKTYNLQIFGNDIDVGGIKTGIGDVTLYAKGGDITISGDSNSNSTGNLTLIAGEDVTINEDLVNAGTGQVNIFAGWDGTSGITTPALFDRDDIDLTSTARNITIGANGKISSAGAGTSVLLVTTGKFTNNATLAANAVTAVNGRYLVYGVNPDDVTKGGLTAKNLYNVAFDITDPASVPGTNSLFLYSDQPILTLTANNQSTTDPVTGITYTYSISGLRSDDLLADSLSGSGTFTPGTLINGKREIQFGLGTLASDNGYAITLVNGALTITNSGYVSPVVVAPPVSPSSIIHQSTNITPISVVPTAIQASTAINIAIAKSSDTGSSSGSSGNSSSQSSTSQSGSDENGDSSVPEENKHEKVDARTSASCLISDAGTGGCVVN